MKHLIFKIDGQSLVRLDSFKPATDSVEYLTVSFEFSSDWSGTTKKANFRKGDNLYPAIVKSDNTCIVPYEVLVRDTVKGVLGKQYFYMSVEGVNGTRKITTDEVKIEIIPSGTGEVTTPSTPTPDVFAQYVDDVKAQTKTNSDNAQQSAENAEASAQSAEASAKSLKNDYSNALKGNASGSVVRVDDVSPVEHYPRVKVRSKNLIPYPYAETTTERDGATFTVNADGGITISGTPTVNTSFNLVMQYTKKLLVTKGKKYILTVNSSLTAKAGYVYLQNWSNGVSDSSLSVRQGSMSFIADKDGSIQIGLVVLKGQTFNETIYIQFEEGETATEYTPYIDPSTVTVRRCGKNLALGGTTTSSTSNGITITRTPGSSIFTFDGTADSAISMGATSPILLPPGKYTVSVYGLNKVSTTFDRCYVLRQNDKSVVVNEIMTGSPKSFILTEPTTVAISFVLAEGTSYSNKKIRLQMEQGDTASEYVECEELTTHTPNADGTVEGITSLSPTMTLLTDTEDVTVEVEYNRDINVVIADILTKLS